MIERRLLSPDEAAIYLGLGSRWAIYRLVSNGKLPSLKVAGKLRLDGADLDAFIAQAKSTGKSRVMPPARGHGPVPRQLAPYRNKPTGRLLRVTNPVTRTSGDG